MTKRKATTSKGSPRKRGRSESSQDDERPASHEREWTPRPYQATALERFRQGIRRQLLIWHRRAGKDNFALNVAAEQADQEVGTYWHLFPLHTQAKKAIWRGIDKSGVKFIDQAFPPGRRTAKRENDMQLELDNGSSWQLCGSDRYDSLVGSNPRGVVFSEWALCDPRAWDYIRPIIRENGGWAIFITTYRGRNHAYRMAQRLKDHPDWYVDVRTVNDTTDVDGSPILTEADIQAERDEDMSEALIQQEYYCNPIAAAEGAIYGKSFERLTQDGRLGAFGYDSSRPVYAAWSLEWDNEYSVVFYQWNGNAKRIIGSRTYPFESLSEVLQRVPHEFPWRFIARHIVPPGTSPEVIDQFETAGTSLVEVAPELDNVYSVTRDALALTWIDNVERAWEVETDNNERLVDAMNDYKFSPATGGQSFTNRPANTWAKHYARAVEVFSSWAHNEPLELGSWCPAPSTALQDRATI